MRWGSCWFVVESKSFEVSVEEVRGKLREIIMERSMGFISWIRFGDGSLRRLLEGIEECCSWEGRMSLGSSRLCWKKAFMDVARALAGRIGDASWLQLGDREKNEQGGTIVSLSSWFLNLGGAFFLLEFEDGEKAERVLKRGMRHFKDKLLLEKWSVEADYLRLGYHAKEDYGKIRGERAFRDVVIGGICFIFCYSAVVGGDVMGVCIDDNEQKLGKQGDEGFRAKRKKKGIAKGKSFCDRRLTSAKGPKLVGIGLVGGRKGLCTKLNLGARGRVSSFSSSLVLGLERVMVMLGEDHGVVGDLVAKEGELIVDPL
ncbi:hypothetical protein CK203_059331 [Vitis vinifera]|uniref:DUF4283 domain-containing protein n=1 Tax=Vitis vinifera TaxID=29760 RepID=A0A438H2Z1_VITVI|nr:hypothetical protein CK203_059331 [Vitis vinifera]